MRLVFVNRFFYPDHSATSQILSDLCFALAARGHEVHVVTSRLRYDDPSDRLAGEDTLQVVREAHAMESAVVHVHRVWTSRFGRGALLGRAMDYFTFYLSALWRLVRLADRSVAKQWGENGRRLFDSRFAMPIAIDRWERLLAEVAQG